MPMSRCLGFPGNPCGRLIDSKSRRGRCWYCYKGVKDLRNEEAAALGPCPQVGLCGYCHQPATPTDRFEWGHVGERFIDGGTRVAPEHRSCNRKHRKNRFQKEG